MTHKSCSSVNQINVQIEHLYSFDTQSVLNTMSGTSMCENNCLDTSNWTILGTRKDRFYPMQSLFARYFYPVKSR